ncbi:MAG TPA: hypothetical protein VGC92_09765 [Phenylobacterium sp.]|jgi:hypothetical protein
MASVPSALDPGAMARARGLLKSPLRRERAWPALASAALLAVSAIAFAVAMLTAPPLVHEHTAHRTLD